MPKISQYTELAEAPASTDEFVIVDKSDTSEAASGTTKKIQAQYLIIADASTTVKGKVELATDAETITGTDTVRAVTPSNITAKQASDAEAITGTSTTKLITPANVTASAPTFIATAEHAATSKTTPVDADEIGLIDSAASYVLKKMTVLALKLAIYAGIKPAEGTMWNGKISVTDTGSGINVALKTLSGNDPSSSEPVYITLAGAVRTITGALSVTKADGTNWMNLGSAELATQEVDLFASLGYNATDGVVIGFSRIPYANQYSDFSVTTTNEKYAAISTITNAAATDSYVVIGRFAATLSAGAGYTWSVPTFTANNLIQRPIYETRKLSYSPVVSFTKGNATERAKYKIIGNQLFVQYFIQFGSTSAYGGGEYSWSTPFSAEENDQQTGSLRALDSGTAYYAGSSSLSSVNSWKLYSSASSGAAWNSTAPFTWASGDQIMVSFNTFIS